MAKKDACAQCKKGIGAKAMSESGKKFCCIECCGKWKKGHEPKVCEFC